MTRLEVWGAWPQVDGSMRYALDAPATARELRAELRRDPAMADAIGGAEYLVDADDGRLSAIEWPGRGEGRRPDWPAIRAAIQGVWA